MSAEKSVRVFCRFRPLNANELANGSQRMVRIDNNTAVYVQSETKSENKFEFDYIFPEPAQQEEVYQVVGKPLVEEVLKGYNATVFAYGQTSCLDPDTGVLMFDGSVKKAKDVVLGDMLMGDDSTPRRVLKLFEGEDDMYTVVPSKGESYKVNSNHVLTVCKSNVKKIYWKQEDQRYKVQWSEGGQNRVRSFTVDRKGDGIAKEKEYQRALAFCESLDLESTTLLDIPIKEYMKFSQTKQKEYLGIRTEVEFPHRDTPIDPYLIGLWLGDGSSAEPSITNVDPEIIAYLYDMAEQLGLNLKQKGNITYRLSSPNFLWEKGSNPFYTFLKDNNLINNKHIPSLYKINSRDVRLKVLAGLIDSDGYLKDDGKNYEMIQKSELLTDDFMYLCRSLGFSCYKTKVTKSCMYKGEKRTGVYYRCNVSGKGLHEIPVLLGRKKATGDAHINLLRTAIKIVPAGRGRFNGWTLDGNGRFLLSDFTITHNSGKTTTMTGYSHLVDSAELLSRDDVVLWKNPKDMGVVPRLIKDLFTAIKLKKDHEFSIQISYVEIYLEKIRDLLNPVNDNLEIRESRFKGLWIEDVTEVYVSSFEEAVKVMRKGETNRTVAATAMNAHSSRSHSVLIINLHQTNTKTQVKTHSRMVFVDLAGSEKVEKTKAEGLIMKQAQATNKSLMTLGVVIRALVDKKPHIPYRDSKLTRLLTDSLGGNSKTHLIVTCSPAIYNIEETVSTLRFGSVTQQIKNKPRVNLEMTVEEYKRQLLQANEKIATQQGIIAALQKDLQKLIALCEKHKIDVKAYKKEYNMPASPTKTSESYEESLERFNQLSTEIEAKTSLITELQRTASSAQSEVEKYKDIAEVLRDDLDHRKQDLDSKALEVEVLTAKIADLGRMYDTLQRQLEESEERTEIKVSEVRLEQTTILAENAVMKTRVAQLVEENQALRENSLRTWKDASSTAVVEEHKAILEKYAALVQSEEDLKQLLEARTRHIKVLEESLRTNGTKIQDMVSEHKRKCIDYEKKIKDLESQMRILRSATPPTNIFTPLKY